MPICVNSWFFSGLLPFHWLSRTSFFPPSIGFVIYRFAPLCDLPEDRLTRRRSISGADAMIGISENWWFRARELGKRCQSETTDGIAAKERKERKKERDEKLPNWAETRGKPWADQLPRIWFLKFSYFFALFVPFCGYFFFAFFALFCG